MGPAAPFQPHLHVTWPKESRFSMRPAQPRPMLKLRCINPSLWVQGLAHFCDEEALAASRYSQRGFKPGACGALSGRLLSVVIRRLLLLGIARRRSALFQLGRLV